MIKSVGIDLGTTNSVLSFINEQNLPECMVFDSGVSLYPSVFCFDGERAYTGIAAVDAESEDHDSTVRSSKRHIGTDKFFDIKNKRFSPIDIAEHILRDIKTQFEQNFNQTIINAVITVPAYFNNQQREHTIVAAKRAGLNVLRIINEPTAAALAYGLKDMKNQNILVYDLGGGTFDVTIMKLTKDGVFEALASAGDTKLGGDDFDDAIARCIVLSLETQYPNYTPSVDFDTRLRTLSEQTKKTLSRVENTTIRFPYCGTDINGKPINFNLYMDRATFEDITAPLIDKTRKLILSALSDTDLKFKDLDHIILVGGSTRLPIVRNKLKEWTGKTPNTTLNPDEAVSMGAAIQASLLSDENPQEIYLIDVTPLSLGVEIENGLMSNIIQRNTQIPCESFENYTTAYSNQTDVEINVYQGERPKASDNYKIGTLRLTNLPKMERGEPEIVVTFRLDINGVLQVSAKEEKSNETQEVVFDQSQAASADIQKMLEEAEMHRDEDELFKEYMTLKNRLVELSIKIDELIKAGLCDKEQVIELYDYKESLKDCENAQNVSAITTIIKDTDNYINNIRDVLQAKAQTEMK